ncbi:MAG: MASE1 domain-containing protein [Spirochaetota bacterium]
MKIPESPWNSSSGTNQRRSQDSPSIAARLTQIVFIAVIYYAGARNPFNRVRDVLKFVFFAALCSQALGAAIGVVSLYIGGRINWAEFGTIWLGWWLSNVVSIIVITPFMLTWHQIWKRRPTKRQLIRHGVVYGLIALGTFLVFRLGNPIRHSFFVSFTIPSIIWSAFILERPGATAATLIVACIAVWSTATGSGAFISVNPKESVLVLEVYLAILSGTGVILSAVLSERKQAEDRLQVSLKEKEALLRELYHRTKNNMQVICAMLELQLACMQDEQAVRVLKEMENRIRSMALVHQKLCQSHNLSSINLREYINELAGLLLDSYGVSSDRIRLNLDLEDVFVIVDTAVPSGLILNELISNALKHAFPGERKGEISIRLHKTGEEIELGVSDNGIGVPPDFNFKANGKIGLQIVFALGEDQLQGGVKFETHNGLACLVSFKDTLYSARV